MEKETLYKRLIPKNRNLDEIALEAIKTPEIISQLLDGIQEKSARVKFGCLFVFNEQLRCFWITITRVRAV